MRTTRTAEMGWESLVRFGGSMGSRLQGSFQPIHSACRTCLPMSRNGLRILQSAPTRHPLAMGRPMVRQAAPHGSCAAATGPAIRRNRARNGPDSLQWYFQSQLERTSVVQSTNRAVDAEPATAVDILSEKANLACPKLEYTGSSRASVGQAAGRTGKAGVTASFSG